MEKLNNRIKQLLELFESGNSTIEQEDELKQLLLNSQELPKELHYAKLYFRGMEQASLIKYNGKLKCKTKRNNWKIGVWSFSTAATIAVIITIAFAINRKPVYATINGTPVTDKEIAEMIVINSIQEIEELITTPLTEIEDVLNLIK